MRPIAALLILALCAGCQYAAPPAPASPPPPRPVALQASSPCNDPLYVSLKEIPINDLSEREYAYFSEHDKACMEYQKATASARIIAKPEEDKASLINTWLILSAFGGLLAVVASAASK